MDDELTQRGGLADDENGGLRGVHEVDRDLVLEALSYVTRTRRDATLDTWVSIGEYVLHTFFGGSIERYRERARRHASFQALLDRHDLPGARLKFWRAVSVAEQVRELRPELGHALSFTHHTLLVSVRDPELKRRLAEACVAEAWSKRRLAAEIRSARPPSKQGRKRRPATLKAACRMATAARESAAEGVDALSVDELLSVREHLEIVECWLARVTVRVDSALENHEGQPFRR